MIEGSRSSAVSGSPGGITAVAARARGLCTTVVSGDALAAIDHASGAVELAAALVRAGLAAPTGIGDPDTIDRLARDRVASDLAILARRTDALAVLALDEDRRSLRAIVRGLAAGVSADRRLIGAVPTATLPASLLAALAGSPGVADLAAQLARRHHPFAGALAQARAPSAPIELLEIELALARRFAGLPRPRDRALHTYVTQVIDVENTASALLLAARGADLELDRAFLPGGLRIDRDTFATAAAGPLDAARQRLADALVRTPLARALFAAAPAALEDAALAWQLATQLMLRRTEPLGLAPAVYLVLRRRDEARRLRRAAWRVALGGAA